jgi:hypothetical protein
MEVRELKIDNYLYLKGKPEKVWGIDLDLKDEHLERISIGEYDMEPVRWFKQEDLKYIPLTDEGWITKINLNLPIIFRLKENMFNSIDFNMAISMPDGKFEWLTIKQVEYVHSVQNLYFELSGEELFKELINS